MEPETTFNDIKENISIENYFSRIFYLFLDLFIKCLEGHSRLLFA